MMPWIRESNQNYSPIYNGNRTCQQALKKDWLGKKGITRRKKFEGREKVGKPILKNVEQTPRVRH